MKSYGLIVTVAASFCFAISVSASVTVQQLTEMAEAKHPEYRALRDAIVAQGEAVLPELDRIYADQSLDWEPRFAAGVCIEHIRRADDLQAFLNHDWWNESGFSDAGPILATGYPRDGAPIVKKVEAEYGLWFYYLEVYSAKIYPEEDTADYRILGKMRSVLVDDSQGEERFFAARIAARMFDEHCPPRELIMGPLEGYLEDLAAYVTDGTYPDGREFIFKHLNAYHPILTTFLENEKNVLFLEEMQHRYPDDSRLQKLIRKQISRTLADSTDTPPEASSDAKKTSVPGPPPISSAKDPSQIQEED